MANTNTIKTITGTDKNIVARLLLDESPEAPDNDLVKIAYLGSSRSTLGSQPCTREELDQIGRDIRSGILVGVPVWAYVHSGATISTGTKLKGDTQARLRENPYHCQWDSGRSGWAYMTAKDALREWGNKRLSPQQKQKAHWYIDGVVEEFAHYLQGGVYGYEIVDLRDEEVLESCWGIYGYAYAVEEAERALTSETKGLPVQMEMEV
jgi:hypothetical protein